MSKLTARKAIEALRSGVPNRDSVASLSVFQEDITELFYENMMLMQNKSEFGKAALQMVLAGSFGSGKSHVLEYLRHLALENNYVTSHITISKENPLFDNSKLLKAAAETAVLPDASGKAVAEVVFSNKIDGLEFNELSAWAYSQSKARERFASLLNFLDRKPAAADEYLDDIAWEWSGYPIKISKIRAALKAAEITTKTKLMPINNVVISEMLWQFLPRFFYAAGYNGWVILFDEVELILRYGKLQRAKAYANIGRLAKMLKSANSPNLFPVFAITDDFWSIADKDRKDNSLIDWLKSRKKPTSDVFNNEVKAGISVLRNYKMLRALGKDEFEELRENVRNLHSEAFSWQAPEPKENETLSSKTVREHIKSWITYWDMSMLYPEYNTDILIDEIKIDYSEDKELSEE